MEEKSEQWIDVGAAADLGADGVRKIEVGRVPVALSCVGGKFGAVSHVCNHAGGPLGEGALDGDYISCPWHHWKFHRLTGEGEPGFESDRVPSHGVKVENGRVLVTARPVTPRHKDPHPPHPLERAIKREAGPIRVLGIGASAMDEKNPRYSGSDDLLQSALAGARDQGAETRMIRLSALRFRACEGYYSKAARACTWPCSITQMDSDDQMDQVYEGLVHWADAVILATPIRWGQASSLYFRMVERLNCVQNQITTHKRVMIRNKVAGFIILGGQDNVQGVAGQLLAFFAELGFAFPPFPYIAHTRGWTAEDMERNVQLVQHSQELHNGARHLAVRTVDFAGRLLASTETEGMPRAGRKAQPVSGA